MKLAGLFHAIFLCSVHSSSYYTVLTHSGKTRSFHDPNSDKFKQMTEFLLFGFQVLPIITGG